MAVTINSNIASLQAQRRLGESTRGLRTTFERLSAGQRINRASDDAAGLAISDSLRADQRVFNQGIRNLNDGLSLLHIADSAIGELSQIVTRMQELAEQSANGTLSNSQRKALDEEAQELKDEFFRVSRSVDFNGLKPFDGSIEGGLRFQGGYGLDGSIQSSLGGKLGDGTFQSPQVFSTGAGATRINYGDMNADGHLDLVTTSSTNDEIVVHVGDGNGSFQVAHTYAVGDTPRSVSLGDFNGDGVLDIVTGNYNSYDSSVLIGIGDGSFQSAQTFGGGVVVEDIDVGDLNGDGALDFVTANSFDGNVSVVLGNGDGTFKTEVDYTVAGPVSVSLGDLNGDGVLDIVTQSYYANTASVLIGNGDGSFGTAQNIASGDFQNSAELGDFNNDGNLDIVTSGSYADEVVVLLGNGDGTFQSGITTTGGGDNLTLGDINGDGNLDVINTGRNVLLGTGDGSFSTAISFTTASNPSDIALADFNGDGVLDAASANSGSSSINVLLSNTREGLSPILDFSLQTQADALQAMAPLSRKLNSLSSQRGIIGAFQSRLQSAINTLTVSSENYSAAESRIRDADIASESAGLTRLQILQQASSAVLAQANQQPALALQLLSS